MRTIAGNQLPHWQIASRNPFTYPAGSSPTALLVVSADLQIRQVSSNIETMLRVTPGAALGRPFLALVGEANAQKILDLPVRGDLQPSIPTLLQFGDQRRHQTWSPKSTGSTATG